MVNWGLLENLLRRYLDPCECYKKQGLDHFDNNLSCWQVLLGSFGFFSRALFILSFISSLSRMIVTNIELWHEYNIINANQHIFCRYFNTLPNDIILRSWKASSSLLSWWLSSVLSWGFNASAGMMQVSYAMSHQHHPLSTMTISFWVLLRGQDSKSNKNLIVVTKSSSLFAFCAPLSSSSNPSSFASTDWQEQRQPIPANKRPVGDWDLKRKVYKPVQ